MSKPHVLVVGSGGVGTIAALALKTKGLCTTTVVVRSDYKKAVEEGYEIDSVDYGHIQNWRPDNISPNVAAAAKDHGPFDYILVTTKNIPDGPVTCEEIIKPAVTDKSVIVLMQNGIGIDEPMFEQFPNNIVLSGITFIGSTNYNCYIKNPGHDVVSFGYFLSPNKQISEEEQEFSAKRFVELYVNEKNKASYEPNVKKDRWQKLIYNASINTTTALVGLDVSRCQFNGASEELFRPAMIEIYKIAASEGVVLDPSYQDKFIHIGDGFFYTPSMLVDCRKEQLMELETILGNPLKFAKRNGVDVPMLTTLYNLLKIVQFGIKEKMGLVKVDDSSSKKI